MPRGRSAHSRRIREFKRAVTNRNLRGVEENIAIVSQEILNDSLMEACDMRNGPLSIPIVERILEAGADITYQGHGALSFLACAGIVALPLIERIMAISRPSNDQLSGALWTIADHECDSSLVEYFIQAGADINYQRGSILWIACMRRKRRLMKLLLQHGANPNLENSKECIHKLIIQRDIETIRAFLDAGAEVEEEDIPALQEMGFSITITDEQREIRQRQRAIEQEEQKERLRRAIEQEEKDRQEYLEDLGEERQQIALAEDRRERRQERQGNRRREIMEERRQRARIIEQENEAKRQAALEEYKNTGADTQSSEPKVNTYCYPGSHNTLMGDTLKDTDDFVVFIEEGTEKGDCYLRSELKEIYRHVELYEFNGPPFGISQGSYRGSRGPNHRKPIYKLPWTSAWIDKEAMNHAIENSDNIIILKGVKQSIGSDHGSFTGQLGGHWTRERNTAVYVEEGNAEPDERPTIYRYVRSENF